MKSIGDYMREVRLTAGETQAEAADRCGIGLDRWRRLERGATLTAVEALQIAKGYDLPASWAHTSINWQ